jgi:hypothetical protein
VDGKAVRPTAVELRRRFALDKAYQRQRFEFLYMQTGELRIVEFLTSYYISLAFEYSYDASVSDRRTANFGE